MVVAMPMVVSRAIGMMLIVMISLSGTPPFHGLLKVLGSVGMVMIITNRPLV